MSCNTVQMLLPSEYHTAAVSIISSLGLCPYQMDVAWYPQAHGIHVMSLQIIANVLCAQFYAILLTIQWSFIHTTYLYAFLPYIPQ